MSRYDELRAFIAKTEQKDQVEPTMISGDASFRKYYRFGDKVYVDAPPATEKNQEFIALSKIYNDNGIWVPKVYSYDLERGFLCIEDLGNQMFSSYLDSDKIPQLYRQAVDVLFDIALIPNRFEPFDEAFIRREDQIFLDWYLGAHLNRKLSTAGQRVWESLMQLLIKNSLSQEQIAMHRDFHCRNIMIADGRLALVDFQDTVTGPLTYDLVSLLKDCYYTLDLQLRSELLYYAYEGFCSRKILKNLSRDAFEHGFDLTGLQRHLKAIGIFCRLLHRDSKDNYLQYLPRTFSYVQDVCGKHEELADFGHLLEDELL